MGKIVKGSYNPTKTATKTTTNSETQANGWANIGHYSLFAMI